MNESAGTLTVTVEWANRTTLHPLGLALLLICGFAMLIVSRRRAVWPMIVIACFVAPAQRLVVLGLDFSLLRMMVLFGWTRILLRREAGGFRWHALDYVWLSWSVVSIIAGTVLDGSMGALVNRLGLAFDAVGMYFMFRVFVRGWDDVNSIIYGCMLISIPVALSFLIEKSTGRNAFAVFGGVPAVTDVREGKLRCQGAFSHAILAGCFFASLTPLFAVQWWRGSAARRWGMIGLLNSLLIIMLCASSTPVMAVLFALLGAMFFLLRRHMRAIRWGLVITLLALHLVMKAPVWHLISRVNVVSGSTGWHRFNIIDQAIRQVDEWWLLGTRNITHWNIWANDVTNQYVVEGITGGFLKLLLFVIAIATAFGAIGRLWRAWSGHAYRQRLAWALGVMLFIHVMNFFAVAYFGQIWMLWYLSLAIIGSLSPAWQLRTAHGPVRPARPSAGDTAGSRATGRSVLRRPA